MTRDQVLLDLYTRLTSRKFIGFLLVVGFAIWNYWSGRTLPADFERTLVWAFVTYGIAEGAVDFATALPIPRPAPENVTTVDASTTTLPPPPPRPTPTVVRKPKRVRPSRTLPSGGIA